MAVCPLCRNSQIETVYAGSEFGAGRHWLFCSTCELYFLSDIPSPEELQAFYSGSYFAAQRSSRFAYRLRAWFSSMRAESQLKYIQKHRVSTAGHVLEVGSSDGSLLKVFKRHGWEVLGLEFSEFGIRMARDRYGITLLPRDITELSPDEYRFDCIVFSHVLEHMPDPVRILEHSRELLTREGFIFVELPHSPLPGEVTSDILNMYLNTSHIYNFRLKSLSRLADQSGLKTLDMTRYFYHVPGFQRKRAPLFGSVLMRSVLETANPVDIANVVYFVLQMNAGYLIGNDTMMPVENHEPWIGFGDNIRLLVCR